MVGISTFRNLALSFPGSSEQPHFDLISFRVNKKIFATLNADKQLVCLMLTEIDQSVFMASDSSIIYPVPNKWGMKGATYVELTKVRKSILKDGLTHAYQKATLKTTARRKKTN